MPNRNTTDGNYRYTYQGQEKDTETGKEAFELRLWDSRIGRWLSPDPYNQYFSPYLGMGNNPINGVDPDGGCFVKDENGNTVDCGKGNVGDTITDIEGATWTCGDKGWDTDAYNDRASHLISDAAMYRMLDGPLPSNHISNGINSHLMVTSVRPAGLGTFSEVDVILPRDFGTWNSSGSDGRQWIGCMACHGSNGALRSLSYNSHQRFGGLIVAMFLGRTRLPTPIGGAKPSFNGSSSANASRATGGAAPRGFSSSNLNTRNDFRRLLRNAIKETSDKVSRSKHTKPKMGNNRAANEQVTSLVKKYGLSRVKQRQLHDCITGQNYSRAEIEGIILRGDYLM